MISKLLLIVFWSVAATGGFYASFIALLTSPFLQRHAFYAHKIHSAWWHNVSEPETFGFAKNQVTPLNISTPDGETLYAWHVLPLGVYAKHEVMLAKQPSDDTQLAVEGRGAFRLLRRPGTRLIINFHGNAGHVAQGWRTDSYKIIASTDVEQTHVLAFDYRGFGHSSGTPTEEGLIIDGVSIVEWAMNVAHIPAENIVIFGHSLGTAVATAVVDHYAQTSPNLDFAALILLSGFSDVPNLMKTYMIGGVIPILSPLKPYPTLQKFISNNILDTWDTATRITRLVRTKKGLKIHILHAKNDMDINWKHSDLIFNAACRGLPGVHLNETQEPEWIAGDFCKADVKSLLEEKSNVDAKHRSIKLSRLLHGGHNRVIAYAPLALAVRDAFESVNYC